MKKSLLTFSYFLVALLLAGSSCNDEEDKLVVCGVEDPLENLEWLKELINEPSYEIIHPEIYYIEYENEEYIAFYHPNFTDPVAFVYSCDGEEVCQAAYYNYCEIWYDSDEKVLLNP